MREVDLSGFSDVVPLGSGGLGDVYRATRTSPGGTGAIKVLRDWSDRDVAWQRAQRELRALVDLRGHANVVNVEEVIDTDGLLAIVMEHAPGGSTVDLLRERGGTLPLPETLLVATDTAAALTASHERGIIHRDIKPHNLLIGAFGNVKVCDFGIAALTRSDDVSNRTDSLSFRYASPEELRGDATVGPAADIYSLAATVHHLLTGTYLPAPDGTARSLPLRNWTAPDHLPSDVEVEFRDLIVRSADREPDNRPTAPELHERFENLATRLGPARCRALPFATDGLDDATRVRTVADPEVERTTVAPANRSATEPIAATAAATAAAAVAAGDPADTIARTTHIQRADPAPPPPEPRHRGSLTLIAFGVIATLAVALIALTVRNGDSGDDAAQATSDTSATTPATAAAATTPVPVNSSPATAPTVPADTTAATAPPASSVPPTTTTPPTTSPADEALAITAATELARFEIAATDRFEGRSFESIDGIAFDARTGRMVAAKEVAPPDVAAADPSRALPALFSFPIDDSSDITPMGTLTDDQGNPYGAELDIEGLAALDDGTFVIVSEGSGELANQGGAFLLRVDGLGAFVSRFGLPDWLTPSEDGTSGFADSLGPHGVTVRPGVPTDVVVIMEAALRQDDPGLIRLTSFDVDTGQATNEWSYPVDEGFTIISMTTVGDRGIVVVEQSLSDGRRELHLVELDGGDEPGGPAPEPLAKQPVATDDATFGSTPWASISDGPSTADGTLTAMLMTDNMFRDATSIGATVALG